VVESYPVGSVELSMRYFADGHIGARNFEAARVAASAVLEGAVAALGRAQWDAVYGASGTVGAVADVLRAEAITDGTITRAAMAVVIQRLIDAGHVDRVQFAGLKDDRRAVIGGGVAIVQALIDLLGLDRIVPARGGLRHGVMVELLQRDPSAPDVRQGTVQRLQRQFGADAAQAQRVEHMALWLFQVLRPPTDAALQRPAQKLRWAALLHEIGMAVSHEDHHRHGEYIVSHADAAGFAEHQLEQLGTLVLAQRGGLRKVEQRLALDPLLRDQVLALRMAIIFCHARRDPVPGCMRIGPHAAGWVLAIDTPWADAHPQSMHLLREEVKAWSRTPWPLRLQVD
jgi:exopolyphosphatase/guanosine-5'-triphosphate,3'-diphosphate pyrophosphatase